MNLSLIFGDIETTKADLAKAQAELEELGTRFMGEVSKKMAKG